MMLVDKIINIIGGMLCIFAARKFAKDDNIVLYIYFRVLEWSTSIKTYTLMEPIILFI